MAGELSAADVRTIEDLLRETFEEEGFDPQDVHVEYDTGTCRGEEQVSVFIFDVWVKEEHVRHEYIEALINTYRKHFDNWRLPLPIYTGSDCSEADLDPKTALMTSRREVNTQTRHLKT